jgi:AcrR family transcriptional regulator
VPQQARSQERVVHILLTAERLFFEQGVDNTSTNQIAREAGMPIGALYQFFANKDAVLDALVMRYRENLARVVLGMQADLPSMSVSDLVRRLIEEGARFAHAHSRFASLLLEAAPNSALSLAQKRLQSGVVQLLETIIMLRAPTVSPEDRHVYAVMGQMLQRAAITRSLSEQRAGNTVMAERIIAESIRMQTAYFEQLLSTLSP